MGQVVVEIGGRSYPLSCRDGDEAHLTNLAAGIAEKAEGLSRSLGSMSEARLLLMSALMIADELHDVRSDKPASQSSPPADAVPDQRLLKLLARAERLVEQVQK
jgi:cell division protein ZapA